MTTTYDTDCQQAADTQGITAITTALAVRGIAVTIEQTGGMTMVATVHLPGDGVLGLTQDGETTQVVEYTADQWAGSVDVEDSQVHRFVSLAAAVNWVQARCAENVAAWWGSQIARNADARGLAGGQVRATAEQQAQARWNWPSGRPRYTVAVDVPPRPTPTFLVRAYDDADHIEPYTEHRVDGLSDAVTALMQAAHDPLTVAATQDDQECTCMPDGAGRHGRACELYDGWNE
ncbi:hypothetical protein [Cellulomonas sp. ES6]|uniref:hypothetical protein n=1 Tax=Cellulomonas sp. ES6 TaxID=3039384 RepID=UPI0024B77EE6|nr:hypothetical protein [Cellulomonas sp. ES6]WHP16465.1 hypothetical protein P9841_12650 [Cellulomonas sp. ES6]